MGKYDYPSEELRQNDYNAYLMQKNRSQEYNMKLREFEMEIDSHRRQAKFHQMKVKDCLRLYNELLRENE